MHAETISLDELLTEARRDLCDWQRRFFQRAFQDGLTPEQAHHRTNCKKGLVVMLTALSTLGEAPVAELDEVTP